MGEKRNAYRILVGKLEGKGRPRRRWVDNIKMDLREIRLSGMDWIDVAEDGDQWRALVCFCLSAAGSCHRRTRGHRCVLSALCAVTIAVTAICIYCTTVYRYDSNPRSHFNYITEV
jgi:hypothetical protein